MLMPLGSTAERNDFGAQLPQGVGRDLIGRAIGAIDDDLEPVEAQVLGEGRLGEVDIAAAGVVDPLGAADQSRRLASFGSFSSSALDRRARPRRSACSRRGRTI